MVEYVIRVRIEGLPDRQDIPEENRIGDVVFDWLGEIEMVATEYEVVSRTIVSGSDGRQPRIRCAARSPDPTLHYATTTRYTLTTPADETIVTCSAACALSWLCREGLPADLEGATDRQKTGRGAAA